MRGTHDFNAFTSYTIMASNYSCFRRVNKRFQCQFKLLSFEGKFEALVKNNKINSWRLELQTHKVNRLKSTKTMADLNPVKFVHLCVSSAAREAYESVTRRVLR